MHVLGQKIRGFKGSWKVILRHDVSSNLCNKPSLKNKVHCKFALVHSGVLQSNACNDTDIANQHIK